MQEVNVNKSTINWKLVGYTVGGCWIIFAFMFLFAEPLIAFLNPLPLVLKGVAGIIIYGYVGGIGGSEIETIFVYWSVMGVLLALCLHKTKRTPSAVMTIIAIAGGLHVVLSALALFPAMLLAGR